MAIAPKKINGYFKYNVTIETLKDISERFKWLCQYDQLEEGPEKEDGETTEEDDDNDDIDYKAKYENAILRIKNLEERLNKYENPLDK